MSEWRTISEATGYQISDDGQVRSVDRIIHDRNGRPMRYRGQQLRPYLNEAQGYWFVTITTTNGKRRNRGVHVLLCEAFHGPKPSPSHEARHLNGNKSDNRADNLAWGSKSQNAFDAVRHRQHWNSRKDLCSRGHQFDVWQFWPDGRSRRRCTECKRQRAAA